MADQTISFLESAQKSLADVDAKIAARNAEIQALRQQQLEAAGNDAGVAEFTKFDAKIEEVQRQVKYLQAQRIVAEQKIAAAKQTEHRAAFAAVRKNFSRCCTTRDSEVAALVAASVEFVTRWRNLCSTNQRLSLAWPSGIVLQGLLIGENELRRAVENEIFRLSAAPFIGGGKSVKAPPAAPGSVCHDLMSVGKPSAIKPLTELMAEANAALLSYIDGKETLPPEPQKPPVDDLADLTGIVEPQPRGPTRSAAEIMASIPKRRLLDQFSNRS